MKAPLPENVTGDNGTSSFESRGSACCDATLPTATAKAREEGNFRETGEGLVCISHNDDDDEYKQLTDLIK